jgi:transcriptional regulator of acetoin/glycerol metabolism
LREWIALDFLSSRKTHGRAISRAIHAAGSRAARAFVPINCAGIVGTLAESLLFGHEKGDHHHIWAH